MKGWLRAKRGAWLGALGAFAAAGLVLVYAAVVPTGQTLPAGSKATPFALTVFSSPSLPPEVQAQEAATAPLLFDRDTTTQHVAFDVSSVQAAFESPQSVSAIKIFGPAPYLLSVKADAGGSFQSPATHTSKVRLDRGPAHFVRVYPTYEQFGQGSLVSVRRLINASQPATSQAGGSPILPNSVWSRQVERINPAVLIRGINTIQFKVLSSSFTNGGVPGRNVRGGGGARGRAHPSRPDRG